MESWGAAYFLMKLNLSVNAIALTKGSLPIYMDFSMSYILLYI